MITTARARDHDFVYSLGADEAIAVYAQACAVLVDATGDPVYGAQVSTLPGKTIGISVAAVPAGRPGPRSIAVELGY